MRLDGRGPSSLELVRALNGQLSFGDGTDADNIKGKWLVYSSNAIADTEDTLVHDLGAVPIGYLVFYADKGGVCYKGTTTWTTSNLYLKSSTASTQYLLWVQLP